MDGRLIKFWNQANELPGLVALSLSKTIKMYPAVGWVRASNIASEDLLLELNDLRKQNIELQGKLSKLSADLTPTINGIADIDSTITLHGTYKVNHGRNYGVGTYDFTSEISWRELFSLIAPYIVEHPNDTSVKLTLATSLHQLIESKGYSHTLNDQEFKTVTIQLKAYGLIKTQYLKTTKGGMALFWSLTDKGEQLMIESRIVRENT
ncbi:hypothetical protein ACET7N_11435 [Aeromonas veronii]